MKGSFHADGLAEAPLPSPRKGAREPASVAGETQSTLIML
jgi:hypothetical protein